jgi:hypothetical protein
MPDETYGRAGYEAYGRSTGGKTFDGRDMPTWNELPQKIRTAWCDAAMAIRVQSFPLSVAAGAFPDIAATEPNGADPKETT